MSTASETSVSASGMDLATSRTMAAMDPPRWRAMTAAASRRMALRSFAGMADHEVKCRAGGGDGLLDGGFVGQRVGIGGGVRARGIGADGGKVLVGGETGDDQRDLFRRGLARGQQAILQPGHVGGQ